MLNIGVVTPTPTPYRDPFWNVVASLPGVRLHVYYCAARTSDRPWSASWEMRYDHDFLDVDRRVSAGRAWWNPRFRKRLGEAAHDALIIGGYNHPAMITAMRFARRRGTPYFLMSESHLNEPRTLWRRIVKRPFVRWVVTGAAGCFPTGTWAREYLVHYGADPARMWFVPNVPDVEALDSRAREFAACRAELRRERALGDGPVVLFVGRLVPFKRVDLLIEAFAAARRPENARLVIVGDGVLRQDLESLARRLGIADRVDFRGFAEPSTIPAWFAAADVMALPSVGETWSVALLEALASSIPVVTTDTVGAAADSVNDPVVGSVVTSGDVRAFSAALAERMAAPADRTLVRERWAPCRRQFRYDVIARRVVDAIGSSLGRGGPSHGE